MSCDSKPAPTPEDRFWSKVAIPPAVMTDCWLWTGAQTGRGYGSFGQNGKQFGAHRVAYKWVNGPIPPGRVVMHVCDNPPCVNPTHLRLGTHADNAKDKVRKRRHIWGSRIAQAKLTEDYVLLLRCFFEAHFPRRQIAALFGIACRQVYQVGNRRMWRHVP